MEIELFLLVIEIPNKLSCCAAGDGVVMVFSVKINSRYVSILLPVANDFVKWLGLHGVLIWFEAIWLELEHSSKFSCAYRTRQ